MNKYSLKNKLMLLTLVTVIPFVGITVYLIFSLHNYSNAYDEIVSNMTIANSYNLNFKEEMDESLYKLVVGAVTFDNIKEDESLEDPYEVIADLREDFSVLMRITTDRESKSWLQRLLRNIDTLRDRVDDIKVNLDKGGHYDENIEMLENNIYILTELIQDNIQYYIYYQTQSIESLKVQLNIQVQKFVVFWVILLVCIGVCVLLIASLISNSITGPIRKLCGVTRQISEGDFSVRAEVKTKDEVAQLSESINEMSQHLEVMVSQIKEDERKMRYAELRLLQEQINPHFLYNTDAQCAGVITWMHTFSPAKMWILGLKEYKKPLCHLHTQFNEELPYDTIDMDFMNENQSAHGDREYGHIVSRMGIERKIIVGHWASARVQEQLGSWMRTALGIIESSHIRVCRFGDNMNNVAVTEGDKVEAQIKFGWEIDHYNVNDLVEYVDAVPQGDVDVLVEEYYSKYKIIDEGRDLNEFKAHVAVQARQEIGIEKFLTDNDYHAVVTHFGMLGGLKQLPGLSIQRLMEKGYGFGAEGDWKVAAMVRMMKLMTAGMKDAKGTSMMEDYTYNLVPGKEGILQAHMLEVCPSVADGEVGIKVCPLSMGNREDPARLVFTSKTGPAVACSLVDLGTRFRLLINAVDCKKVEKTMPKLPVGTAFWTPQPNLEIGATAWILAGGAHHTAFSYDLTVDQMADWAAAMGIESVVIDKNTTIRDIKNELRWNEAAYR